MQQDAVQKVGGFLRQNPQWSNRVAMGISLKDAYGTHMNLSIHTAFSYNFEGYPLKKGMALCLKINTIFKRFAQLRMSTINGY